VRGTPSACSGAGRSSAPAAQPSPSTRRVSRSGSPGPKLGDDPAVEADPPLADPGLASGGRPGPPRDELLNPLPGAGVSGSLLFIGGKSGGKGPPAGVGAGFHRRRRQDPVLPGSPSRKASSSGSGIARIRDRRRDSLQDGRGLVASGRFDPGQSGSLRGSGDRPGCSARNGPGTRRWFRRDRLATTSSARGSGSGAVPGGSGARHG